MEISMKTIKNNQDASDSYFYNAIHEILDVDTYVLKACNYDNAELTGLFNKAVKYHNSLSELNTSLQELETSISQTWPGEYSKEVKTVGYTANALKLTQQMNHIENRLSRLADSIMLRAKLVSSSKTSP
jgi:hypothetical protein